MKKNEGLLKRIFSLDYRSLALMRIGLGITILCDLIQRSFHLFAFYSDGGVLPRYAILEHSTNNWFWSLHTISGMWQFQLVLFIISAIAALALICGYRTTLATLISWILLVSLHNRNPLVLQGGDVIFRVVLFWSLFLPWGRYMSVDSVQTSAVIKSKNVYSAATIAYVLQIVFFYLFSGLLKTGESWDAGFAVNQTLHIDQLTTNLGHFLASFPSLLYYLTFIVVYLEFYGSLLLLSPWKNGQVRTIMIILFALMQIGFNSTLHLGLFGLISIVVTLGLLPSWFWDVPVRKVKELLMRKNSTPLLVYYDSNCGFCFKTIFLLKRLFLLPATVKIQPSTGDTAIEQEMSKENSWIIITSDGTHYYKSEGLRELLRASPLFFWKAYFFSLPGVIKYGNHLYEKVAHSRLQICLPENEEIKTKKNRLLSIGIIILIAYVFIWNVRTLPYKGVENIPNGPRFIAEVTRLDQKWSMFAPTPLSEDGWYVFPGELVNGSLVDVFQDGSPVTYEKPEDVSELYENQRWQKYLMNLWINTNKDYRLYYGRYICREWNKGHEGGQKLKNFKIVFMLEITNLDGSEQEPTPTTIWNHVCF
jgi:predicted DCC family thiol-disulfide oxidoreductase YuxK